MAERHAMTPGLDRLAVRGLCLGIALLMTAAGRGVPAASAQFGAIGGAARRAAEEAKKKAPVDKNENAAGKANNRRVEFIKK